MKNQFELLLPLILRMPVFAESTKEEVNINLFIEFTNVGRFD